MRKIRIIPIMDIKGPNLIKTIQLEGLRVIGNPNQFALNYYNDDADEIIYMDRVASLYGRNNLFEIISKTAQDVFIPLTVGGGVRSVDDAYKVFRAGADKVAVNTAAIKNIKYLRELIQEFGSQSIVISIEAKKINDDRWEPYTECGREKTGLDAIEWAKKCVDAGVGEILVTSIDREGTRKGFDIDLIKKMTSIFSVPVIASGGMGKISDIYELCDKTDIDAIGMADVLHYKRMTITEIKKDLIEKKYPICKKEKRNEQ